MSEKHVKIYICDGKSCKEDDGSRFGFYDGPCCYMNGGDCWHTTDMEHALFAKYHRINTSFGINTSFVSGMGNPAKRTMIPDEVIADGKTCFETVKNLLSILNM